MRAVIYRVSQSAADFLFVPKFRKFYCCLIFLTMANDKGHCTVCKKMVLDCQKATYCSICCTWVHLKCTTMDNDEFSRILCSPDNWYCSACLAAIFAFNQMEDDIAFVDCLYCNSKVNSLNVSVNRNSAQLKISSRLTLNSKYIDPDKYFYNAHQITVISITWKMTLIVWTSIVPDFLFCILMPEVSSEILISQIIFVYVESSVYYYCCYWNLGNNA